MFLDITTIVEWLKGKNRATTARIVACFLAPGIVMAPVISGILGGSFGLDLDRPLTITPLRTEVSANGTATQKPGVALIVEPVPSEYRIQFRSAPSHLWSSLDEQAAKANQDRLTLDSTGVTGKAPFMGVSDPVTVVVDGQLGEKILFPGRTVSANNWELPSRRSDSVVFGALFSCVFAFGLSLGGLPSSDRGKHSAS